MSMVDLLLILLVAVPCGALAQLTSAYSRKGWLLHIGLAFMGGFLGVWIARSFDVPTVYILKLGVHKFEIIWSLIGSVFTVAALGMFIKPKMR